MKKIYSIVLMAALLLVGTNAWAVVRPVATAQQLDSAWVQAQDGDVIQLTAPITMDKSLWLGTQTMKDQNAISLELDLNGKVLSIPATMEKAFVITHGALNVKTLASGGQIIHMAPKNQESKYVMFLLYGSTYKDNNPATQDNYFSHLNIGEGVSLVAKACGIVVDRVDWPFNDAAKAAKALGAHRVAVPTSLYSTNVSHWIEVKNNVESQKTRGIANGVRIDVYGSVEGYKYGIKSNGNLGCPSDSAWGSPSGFYQDIEDTPYKWEANDGDYTPFIYIHSGANIFTDNTNSKAAVAAYSGGFARWKVEGNCKGSTGVFVKSGEIVLNDAVVESNYNGGDYTAATATSSGVNCGGSGIVMQSASNYAGDIAVTVSGDTKVAGTTGYAIDEAVTTTTEESKVDAITITGGSFEGGNAGTIQITETTAEAAEEGEASLVIIGGTADNTTSTIGNQSLVDYLSDQTTSGTAETHVTFVENEKGNLVMVITEGSGPDASETKSSWDDIADFEDGTDANWTGTGAGAGEGTIADGDTVHLGELQILAATAEAKQELTIENGGTLIVGTLLMNKYAQIIVKAGGMLIVEGEQGITAPSVNNIILETSETKQATFLFNPAVTSNRHPNASVQLKSKAYRKANGQYVFQRFGVPAYNESVTRADVKYTVPTAIYRYDYAEDSWKSMANTDKFMPFQCYELTTQQAAAGEVYTFECPLVGNIDAELQLQAKWNYYSNSYSAPINIKQMINRFKQDNASVVYPTVYLYDAETNWWVALNNANYLLPNSPDPKEIAPMQAFIFMRTGEGLNPAINYDEQVWTPITNPKNVTYKAPARDRHMVGTAVIEIADANGKLDKVTLIEGEQFSADIDLSYDAEKYMNAESFNLFAEGSESPMAIVATDDLEGTMLSMSSKSQTSFTMTFSNVSNMNYAVRDMLTGTEVEIVEGATYMFSVPADATVEGRFQIIEKANAPTAIENIEETAAVKGIFTITGQFVGNDYHSLPNGVYVVDGKKIVK